ncbi:NAD(+)--arginine ADP-ribosyltransferase EFV [Anatilimnocola aggregata]|uniref:NAD(+)--arginine ADP-ribosyltransferase EFV n=1 Tax=Anatilimnocola aggregata TaxID=2528021 RepID=A0A517YK44_9BACT|nr:phage minor head protein [Anatilimnocola aggregata]QDU30595.1 NAD(+)--arginine ADP-ribosyltransferase EFV [Anatilimnocola aggregata]
MSAEKTHGTNERRLAKPIRLFLTGQARRVAAEVRQHGTITAALVPLIFRADVEHLAFLKAVRTPMATTIAGAALAELRRHAKPKKRNKADDSLEESLLKLKGLPKEAFELLKEYLHDLEAQPFWAGIQASTEKRLTELITGGIADGLTNRDLAKLIAEELGAGSAARALAIARTETTGLMNAGHAAVHKTLGDAGLITGKTWSATLDKDVRAAHLSLHGVTVKPDENFNVGGFLVPYPGHWSLPAQQRVNCRCLTTTKSAFEEGTEDEYEDDAELINLMAAAGML